MLNILADFVVRFNAGLKKHSKYIYVPYSHMTIKVVRMLFTYNCIVSFSIVSSTKASTLLIKIVPLYINNEPTIRGMELMSKPGLRLYWSSDEFAKHYFRNNFQGFYVVSTSTGLCSSNDLILAHILKKPVGGEVLLKLSF